MKAKINLKNDLERYIAKSTKTKKSYFLPIDACDLVDFPKLDVSTIRKFITFGSYQIDISYSYISEHLKKNGKYLIKVDQNNINDGDFKILTSEKQSRHSNATRYKVFIKYKPNDNSSNSITSWACSCFSGSRTVGCCSHVAALICYFSFAKYLDKIPNPGSSLDDILIRSDDENVPSDNETDLLDTTTLVSNLTQVSNMKRVASLSFDQTISKRSQISIVGSQASIMTIRNNSSDNAINYRTFTKHLPENGGVIALNIADFDDENYFEDCLKYSRLKIYNTCTIDYFLLGLWCSSLLSNSLQAIILENKEKINTFKYFF